MFDKYEQYQYKENAYKTYASVLNILGGLSGTLGFYIWFFNDRDIFDPIFITAVALGFALVFLSGAIKSYADELDEEWINYRQSQNYYLEQSKKSHQSITPTLKPKEQVITKESHPNVIPLQPKAKFGSPQKKY